MTNQKHDLVVILDFGAQYSMLIARRIRECNVYCEILPYNTSLEALKQKNTKAIIISGGPSSIYDPGAPKLDNNILTSDIPLLGICYGVQLISHELGGQVEKADVREYGKAELHIDDNSDIFAGIGESMQCWMSHGDSIVVPPKGFTTLATTPSTPHAAIGSKEKKIFGVQFHPEVVHTPKGLDIIKNFLYVIAGVKPTWTTASFVEESVKELRARIGKEKILCALSGGVDSTTVAALVHKAVGDQLVCMFIDQGFMRKDEPRKIVELFHKYFKINIIHVDASKRFFEKMKGVADPEQKRKVIGTEFIRTFEEEAKKLGHIPFLAQGTLYPDVIESAVPGLSATTAHTIKTHHNVGGLPKDIKFTLVEPFRKLFKDEVRLLGRELEVPEEIVTRQPFPGPGLAIRVIGEVTPERVKILQEVDSITLDEIRKAGFYKQLWQSFAVLLPIRTVGVMGDERTYLNTVAIRAVTSTDAMTADWAKLPYDLLERISNRIVNETPMVNRVVYDISSKPPSTIEWE